MTEMVGFHHQLNGHEFEQTPGDGEGQGRQVCCGSWVTKSWTPLCDRTTTKRKENDHLFKMCTHHPHKS